MRDSNKNLPPEKLKNLINKECVAKKPKHPNCDEWYRLFHTKTGSEPNSPHFFEKAENHVNNSI